MKSIPFKLVILICSTAQDSTDGADDSTSIDMLAEEGSMDDHTLK